MLTSIPSPAGTAATRRCRRGLTLAHRPSCDITTPALTGRKPKCIQYEGFRPALPQALRAGGTPR
ncbi:membrane efflux protein, partial [Streptomyces azureus]